MYIREGERSWVFHRLLLHHQTWQRGGMVCVRLWNRVETSCMIYTIMVRVLASTCLNRCCIPSTRDKEDYVKDKRHFYHWLNNLSFAICLLHD